MLSVLHIILKVGYSIAAIYHARYYLVEEILFEFIFNVIYAENL